ncbi:unnamed protein product, partial [Prorocentrum cordatum]
MTILVAHALHSGSEYTKEERREWWADIKRVIARWKVDMCMIDANGRLGQIISKSVGEEGYRQEEDENGAHWHDTLLEGNLGALNTLIPQTGSGATWRPSVGAKEHRIDYIAAADHWKDIAQSCFVIPDLDVALERPDHFPVVVVFASKSLGKNIDIQGQIDRAALQDAERREVFRQVLKSFPRAPAVLDVNEHADHITWCYQEALRVAFPRSSQNPIKPYITPEVLCVVAFRRRLRQISRSWRRMNASQIDNLLVASLDFPALESCQDLSILAQSDTLQEALEAFQSGALGRVDMDQ